MKSNGFIPTFNSISIYFMDLKLKLNPNIPSVCILVSQFVGLMFAHIMLINSNWFFLFLYWKLVRLSFFISPFEISMLRRFFDWISFATGANFGLWAQNGKGMTRNIMMQFILNSEIKSTNWIEKSSETQNAFCGSKKIEISQIEKLRFSLKWRTRHYPMKY